MDFDPDLTPRGLLRAVCDEFSLKLTEGMGSLVAPKAQHVSWILFSYTIVRRPLGPCGSASAGGTLSVTNSSLKRCVFGKPNTTIPGNGPGAFLRS